MHIPWDEYETAILIDACLRCNRGEAGKSDVVRETSRALRQMAVNRGRVIDDIYRNENGLDWKFEAINGLIKHTDNGLQPSKMFKAVVRMMETDRARYSEILKEAKNMVQDNRKEQEAFFEWLLKRVKAASASDYFFALSEYEKFAKRRGYINTSVFEIAEPNEADNIYNEMFAEPMLRELYRKNAHNIKKLVGYYKEFLSERHGKYVEIKHNENTGQKEEKPYDRKYDTSETDEKQVKNDVIKLVFNNKTDVAYTKPVYLIYNGKDRKNVYTWAELYICFMKLITADFPKEVYSMVGRSVTSVGRIDIATRLNTDSMKKPKQIAYDLFVEINLSANNIVKKIARWMSVCGLGFETVEIGYRKGGTDVPAEDKYVRDNARAEKPVVQNAEAENYKKVLKEKFARGYKADSSIELKKFKRAYENIFGRTIPESDEIILNDLKSMCIHYGKNLYLPGSMLSEEKRNRILTYIQSELSDGKNAVYYDILFDRFEEEFEDECIYNSEMLKVYLENTCRGEYFFDKSYLSDSYINKADPEKEVRRYLIEKAVPVSVDEIVSSLSHIPESDIKAALSKSINILKNSITEYFDISIIDLTQNEMHCIEDVINSLIYQKGYACISEITKTLKAKYPDIYDRCQIFSEQGITRILKYKLGFEYSVKGKTVRKAEEEKSLTDIYVSYAKDHDTFTIDELKAIKDEFGSVINFDKVYENSVRVSQTEFVARSLIHFDTERIDEVIDDYCQDDYIPICAITQFGTFPDCGYAWNSFLLEHYAADFSKKYMLLHTRYNETECVGAIVKRRAGIESYDELIIRVLAGCGLELTNDAALNYLFENGYIASRSYRGIDNLIHKAKQKLSEEGM